MASSHRAPGTVNRSKGIGGSDVAALCGLSRYKTPFQLYLEKRGELDPEIPDTTRLRFGRRLEKPVADEFAFITGRKLWRERVTQRHPEFDYMLANIDRWQLRADTFKGVYEGKTADERQRPLWTQGGVPDAYYLQLQWYLAVTGCSFGSYGVLFGLSDFHFFDVDRDEATIQSLLDLAKDFWDRVKTGNPPDYTFGEAGAALAKRLYEKATPKKQMLFEGPEAEVKIKRLLQLKASIKQREAEERDLITWLQVQMKDAEIGTFPGLAKINWSNASRRNINLTRLRAERPEIAEQFTEISESRRFLVTANPAAAVEPDTMPDAPFTVTSGVRQIELD